MAYNVTSQWDDIHRKLGNYEELPVEKKQEEYTKEAIEVVEHHDPLKNKTLDELEELEDDLDEEYLEMYKQQRLKELEEYKKKPTFEGVREITRQDYIDEVTEATKGTYVVLHLYQSSIEACGQVDQSMAQMCKLYPHIKFLKIEGNKCIENYPDKNCPTIIIYLNGSMVITLPQINLKYRKVTVSALEDMLQGLKILPKKDKRDQETVENYKSSIDLP